MAEAGAKKTKILNPLRAFFEWLKDLIKRRNTIYHELLETQAQIEMELASGIELSNAKISELEQRIDYLHDALENIDRNVGQAINNVCSFINRMPTEEKDGFYFLPFDDKDDPDGDGRGFCIAVVNEHKKEVVDCIVYEFDKDGVPFLTDKTYSFERIKKLDKELVYGNEPDTDEQEAPDNDEWNVSNIVRKMPVEKKIAFFRSYLEGQCNFSRKRCIDAEKNCRNGIDEEKTRIAEFERQRKEFSR